MSSAELSPVNILAKRLISLCKEFTASLLVSSGEMEKLCARASEIRSRRSSDPDGAAKDMNATNVIFCATHGKVRSLQPAIDDLARTVSQQIEHAELEFTDKLELKLRTG